MVSKPSTDLRTISSSDVRNTSLSPKFSSELFFKNRAFAANISARYIASLRYSEISVAFNKAPVCSSCCDLSMTDSELCSLAVCWLARAL
ncbi:Uncharacterised protein [Vibrio cholerae]|nr:Uncharacterised protein [Vibrio cholerae]CSD37995.1 Uncharacterised protein [Vibrio cholerae]